MVVALALWTPIAAGGSERDAELEDDADVANKSADVLAVWLQTQRDGVRVTFKVHTVRAPVVQNIYELTFRVDGRELSPAIGWDWDGRLRTSLHTPTGWGRDPATVDDLLVDPRFQPGSPALLSFTIPWDVAPGFDRDARLSSLEASSIVYDAGARRWITGYDTAGSGFFGVGTASYDVDGAFLSPFAVVVLVLACGAAGGYAGWRFLRARGRS